MDAEVEKAADQSTTTDDDQQSWRSWFGKGITHVAADGAADDDTDELDVNGLDADGLDADGLDADGLDADGLDADGPDGAGPDGAGPDGAGPDGAGLDAGGLDTDELDTDGLAAGHEADEVELARPRMLRWPLFGGERQVSFPLTVRPLIHPRFREDPRWRVWITRTVVCLILFIAVSMWLNWRFGLTVAVIFACADTLYRSKTTVITPTSVRVTSAQRSTARRLRVLRTAGYMALHARTVPGTETVIDHVVVGPSGVFTVDSQRMDKRLPVRAIGGMLFHGPVAQTEKIDHARFEAERAASLIANELGQRVRVRPAMVVYGPSVPWIIMRIKGVDVFDGRHVGTYFRRQSKAASGHQLDTAQVALVFAAAAHALPGVS